MYRYTNVPCIIQRREIRRGKSSLAFALARDIAPLYTIKYVYIRVYIYTVYSSLGILR